MLVGAFIQMLREHFAIVPLLLGASSVLTALSWAPNLLLKPTLPTTFADMEPVEIPRVAAFFIAMGAFLLIVGTIVAWVLRGEL